MITVSKTSNPIICFISLYYLSGKINKAILEGEAHLGAAVWVPPIGRQTQLGAVPCGHRTFGRRLLAPGIWGYVRLA